LSLGTTPGNTLEAGGEAVRFLNWNYAQMNDQYDASVILTFGNPATDLNVMEKGNSQLRPGLELQVLLQYQSLDRLNCVCLTASAVLRSRAILGFWNFGILGFWDT
jgi:hypothetical protein